MNDNIFRIAFVWCKFRLADLLDLIMRPLGFRVISTSYVNGLLQDRQILRDQWAARQREEVNQ